MPLNRRSICLQLFFHREDWTCGPETAPGLGRTVGRRSRAAEVGAIECVNEKLMTVLALLQNVYLHL